VGSEADIAALGTKQRGEELTHRISHQDSVTPNTGC